MDNDKISGANKYELPHRSRKEIMFNNFIGGLFWSIGAFIGIILIVTLIGIIASKIHFVPIIGNWLGDVLKVATKNLKLPTNQ